MHRLEAAQHLVDLFGEEHVLLFLDVHAVDDFGFGRILGSDGRDDARLCVREVLGLVGLHACGRAGCICIRCRGCRNFRRGRRGRFRSKRIGCLRCGLSRELFLGDFRLGNFRFLTKDTGGDKDAEDYKYARRDAAVSHSFFVGTSVSGIVVISHRGF